MKSMKILVKGMSCNHCEARVTDGIRSLEGVEEAKANLASGRVVVTGNNIDLNRVRETVENLGYKFMGRED